MTPTEEDKEKFRTRYTVNETTGCSDNQRDAVNKGRKAIHRIEVDRGALLKDHLMGLTTVQIALKHGITTSEACLHTQIAVEIMRQRREKWLSHMVDTLDLGTAYLNAMKGITLVKDPESEAA